MALCVFSGVYILRGSTTKMFRHHGKNISYNMIYLSKYVFWPYGNIYIYIVNIIFGVKCVFGGGYISFKNAIMSFPMKWNIWIKMNTRYLKKLRAWGFKYCSQYWGQNVVICKIIFTLIFKMTYKLYFPPKMFLKHLLEYSYKDSNIVFTPSGY